MPGNLIDPTVIYKFPEPGTYYKEFGNSICAVTEDIDLQLLYSMPFIMKNGYKLKNKKKILFSSLNA